MEVPVVGSVGSSNCGEEAEGNGGSGLHLECLCSAFESDSGSFVSLLSLIGSMSLMRRARGGMSGRCLKRAKIDSAGWSRHSCSLERECRYSWKVTRSEVACLQEPDRQKEWMLVVEEIVGSTERKRRPRKGGWREARREGQRRRSEPYTNLPNHESHHGISEFLWVWIAPLGRGVSSCTTLTMTLTTAPQWMDCALDQLTAQPPTLRASTVRDP